jgi:hypothetical protein
MTGAALELKLAVESLKPIDQAIRAHMAALAGSNHGPFGEPASLQDNQGSP